MDKFIVSARKYRPQNFGTVIGQSHITTTLKNAIKNNQLAHAFLFCGPRGVGKTTCARILAKTINCEKRNKDGEACNKCNSCVSFDNGTSFNIHELDAASNNGINDIKELIDQVRFAPQAGMYKVYIIDEIHMLSASAFNAFLKTLEEPPPYAIFILATTEKHKILPTILSRCQIFDFKRITTQDTVDHLLEITGKEKISAEKSALHVIAQKSEGCLRDALSILDKIVSFTGGQITYSNTLEHLNILDEDYFFRLLDLMLEQKLADALLLFDEINAKGFEGDTLLEGFAEFIRNLLVAKDKKASVLLDVAEDFKSRYAAVATSTDTGWMIAALNIINETALHYKQARNKRLHIELSLIKLSYLSQAISITTEGDALVKKKITEQIKSVNFKALPIIKLPEGKKVTETINREIKSPEKKEQAVLLVEEPKPEIPSKKTATTIPAVSTMLSEGTKIKLGSLSKIQEQIAGSGVDKKSKIPLNSELLNEAWKKYILKLSEAQNHSAVSGLQTAILKINTDEQFDIVTDNNIQMRFIEAERSSLVPYLQDFFHNKQLTYQILLEQKESPTEAGPRPLNAKEHYQLLSETFPLVKELKERLKLDVDY